MHRSSTKVFSDVIDSIAGDKPVREDDKRFIAEFFSYGMTGTIVSWVSKGMRDTPQKVVSHIENLVNDCQRLAIARYMLPDM